MSDKKIEYIPKDLPIKLIQREVKNGVNQEELLHWHDEIELLCIREGELHCHVNDSDFLLKKNELCCINLNQMHRIYNTRSDKCTVDVLIIKTDMLAYSNQLYNRYVKTVIDDQNFSHIKIDGRHSNARFISDIYGILYGLLEEKPDGYELDVMGYIHMIIRRLYLAHSAGTPITPYDSDTEIQRRMSSYLYENYGNKISLDDIALAGGVSKSKCAVLFQKYTQKTPFEYLNSYRLDMSRNLLETTEMTVLDIAIECGFTDQSYYTRQFKKRFDCTPNAYRKSVGK